MTVVGTLSVPEHLRFLEPLVVVPAGTPDHPAGLDRQAPLALVVVLAASPPEVAVVEATVRSLLVDTEPDTVTVETSAELAAIRTAVSGELGSHARSTVLGILAIAALLVAVNLFSLVTMRRRDFGRRRGLGATRSLITGLLVCQVTLLAAVGAVIGTVGTVGFLVATGNPLPGGRFTVALLLASVLTAALAAIPPAALAARRDPLHELRVP